VLALLGQTCMGRQERERAAVLGEAAMVMCCCPAAPAFPFYVAVLGAALHVHELLSSSFGAAGLGPHVCCIVVEKKSVQAFSE